MMHRTWVDRKKVRMRFRGYRLRLRSLELQFGHLQEEMRRETESVRYYRVKLEETRQALDRVRSRAKEDQDESDRVRVALHDELDKAKKEVGRCRRGQ